MEIKVWDKRSEKGITLKELSLRTGISKSALQRIESGKVSPTLEKLEKIAEALGVRVTDLFKE
ncbi:MAG: helix-turn-helix domain-containing protein [Lachnospiraceae bacterium]